MPWARNLVCLACAVLLAGAANAGRVGRKLQNTFGIVAGDSNLLMVGLVDMPGCDLGQRVCDVSQWYCSNACSGNEACAGYTYVNSGPSGDMCCYLKTEVRPHMLTACKPGDACGTFVKTDRVPNANVMTTPKELLGVWLGDEKFKDPAETTSFLPYATNIMVQPATKPGRRLFTWISARGYSADNGIDPINHEFSCDAGGRFWFKDTLLYGYGEVYVEQLVGWQCLPPDLCTDDLGPDGTGAMSMPEDWMIYNKSCTRFANWDMTRAPGVYTCFVAQTSLIGSADGESDKMVITTLTYGNESPDPWGACPSAATFDSAALTADDNAAGSVRMALQTTYSNQLYDDEYDYGAPPINLADPCTWGCLAVVEGVCCQDETGFPYTCSMMPTPSP